MVIVFPDVKLFRKYFYITSDHQNVFLSAFYANVGNIIANN